MSSKIRPSTNAGASKVNNKNNLIEEIKVIVRKEIEEALKKLKDGKVTNYSKIMNNLPINSKDIYGNTSGFKHQQVFDSKNTYQRMKNKINYRTSTDTKEFVNKPTKGR